MSVAVARRPDLIGVEEPRIFTPPLRELTPDTSLGFECCEFAEGILGMELLPWQRWFLIHALELVDPDRLPEGASPGDFRFRTVTLLVGRQSGKTSVAQALTLWRLLVDDARLVLTTAQNLDVANATVQAVDDILQGNPDLAHYWESAPRAGGKFGLKLSNGAQMKAVTSDRNAARSMSADLVFIDEIREHHKWDAWNAIEATKSTRSRGMILATTNAGDDRSIVLHSLRNAGLADIEQGNVDTRSALFEYSVPDGADHLDESLWPMALPGLGVTSIISDIRDAARRPGNEAGFRTEYLCQFVNQIEVGPFGEDGWLDCLDAESQAAADSPIGLAVDVSNDRSFATLAIAGLRDDGLTHVEVIAHRAGTEWIAGVVRDNIERIGAEGVALQGRGSAASTLREALESEGVTVVPCEKGELPAAMGRFYDLVVGGGLRHRGQGILDKAAETAAIKPLGDTWAWDRKNSPVDVSPLCAATFAVWALERRPEPEPVSAYVAQGDEDNDGRWWE